MDKILHGTVQVFERQSVNSTAICNRIWAASCKRVVDRKKNSSLKKFSDPCQWVIDIFPVCSALNQINLEAPRATFKKCYVLKCI